MRLNQKGGPRKPVPILIATSWWILLVSVVSLPTPQPPVARTIADSDAIAAVIPSMQQEQWPDSIGPSAQRDSIVADEARKAGMPVGLAIAVSHVENWSGDSTARSRVGAIGLMQVMPSHWNDSFLIECGFTSLESRRRNACVGVRVAMLYFEQHGDWNKALRAYNGALCRGVHSYVRCQRLVRAGDEYVLTVMRKLFRTDLSPDRDAIFLASRNSNISID